MAGEPRDLDELRAGRLKREEELKKQVYIDGEYLVINVAYEYNIELKRCDTLEKILGWVTHLCEKTWITPTILERFARVAAHHHGLDIPNP